MAFGDVQLKRWHVSITTVGQTISALHESLRDYIEAAYHISHPALVQLRRELLDTPGVISQRPYLESTPRYRNGPPFATFRDLHPAVREIFTAESARSGRPLVPDPPYEHQARAVEEVLVNGRSLVVTTGTGSGKTECFLLPILGKLATEAHSSPDVFGKQPGVRALILYPMNALVNDQLSRLRLVFGDDNVIAKFRDWSGRPARFARYTSRTLYPGVRTAKRDTARLKPLRDFYARYEKLAQQQDGPDGDEARRLVTELKRRGKWPAKPSMAAWYGEDNARWQDRQTGCYLRCIAGPSDAELLTRHEVQQCPPDILVTNYSMLEYMLMRPIERPIFEYTQEWLSRNPKETFLLVIDEAHLYRGAAGAEVALLVRRLRMRLGIAADRLQVVCTSASFQDPGRAVRFGAQLAGKDPADFAPAVSGELSLRKPAARGDVHDAEALAAVDLAALYAATDTGKRLEAVRPLLDYRGVKRCETPESALWAALSDLKPMNRLINLSMASAIPIDALASEIFHEVDGRTAESAVTALLALGSLARQEPDGPNLLPCRVHTFFRGLPGLWACMDPDCAELPPDQRGGPTGRLYCQPVDVCKCGARVLEFFTCRNCGTAYARAYIDEPGGPSFLWSEPGRGFRTTEGEYRPLQPVDLLLEPPSSNEIEPADYDIVTGRLNPEELGGRTRRIFLRKDRSSITSDGKPVENPGEFRPCGVCIKTASFGRTYVQDHQTKGDEPFAALVTKQIQVQPPSPGVPATRFAPLRGRKVLVFSDSRQGAARLAPRLQNYATQDALRPLIVYGYRRLLRGQSTARLLSLSDIYFAVLLAAAELDVRLRPALKTTELFTEYEEIREKVATGQLEDESDLLDLLVQMRTARPPESLLDLIFDCVTGEHYGLESLALASLCERAAQTDKLTELPSIPGVAETPEQKLWLARLWLSAWRKNRPWLSTMPQGWWNVKATPHTGRFTAVNRQLGDSDRRTQFEAEWLPELLRLFAEEISPGKFRAKGAEFSLAVDGPWAYCGTCRTTLRPIPGSDLCSNCGRATAKEVDPDFDPVFSARKGYYRSATVQVLSTPPVPPVVIIAAEHTAQLNVAQAGEVWSKAEEHELLFQDVPIVGTRLAASQSAIDVLCCTTTMEVGIDIGSLSGVALRNMPPARANYQQRSGRAGRRGNAIASVIAFGGADSHDEQYFVHPDEMIRGQVEDPRLTLDNLEIARRHARAYLLQRYHQDRLPDVLPEEQPQLFAVLGTVADFLDSTSRLNRQDLESWLSENEATLRSELGAWLPEELADEDRTAVIEEMASDLLREIDAALLD